MNIKASIRCELLEIRKGISKERREQAATKLTKDIYKKIIGCRYILSFASKVLEINLWALNERLSAEHRLLLPKLIDRADIIPYKVEDLTKDLIINSKWKVLEPNANTCMPIPLKFVDCVLVPGIGFDKHNNRLGYGKGIYDKFLSELSCPIYGVAFREQYVKKDLPVMSHDVKLTQVYLF